MSEPVRWLPRLPDGVDGHGNPAWRWPDPDGPDAVTVPVRAVAPRTDMTGEAFEPSREAVVSALTVYLPAGAPVPDVSDRMLVRGRVWDVIGQPTPWVSPAGAVWGTEVALGWKAG